MNFVNISLYLMGIISITTPAILDAGISQKYLNQGAITLLTEWSKTPSHAYQQDAAEFLRYHTSEVIADTKIQAPTYCEVEFIYSISNARKYTNN